MKISLLHPSDAAFPRTDFNWLGEAVYPVGVLGSPGQSDVVVGIIQVGRNRSAVAVHPDGSVTAIDVDAAGTALHAALEFTGSSLWGNSWNSAVGDIFGINRRTTQLDRVSTNLLPPKVLMGIAYLASLDGGPMIASLLQVIAKVGGEGADRAKTEQHVQAALDFLHDDHAPETTQGFR